MQIERRNEAELLMLEEGASDKLRERAAELRHNRNRKSSAALLGLLYAHHRDEANIQYRVIDLPPEKSERPQETVDALVDIPEPHHLTTITPKMPLILHEVARFYNIGTEDILSHKRTLPVRIPRHMAFYLFSKLTRNSYAEIGRRFGDRDHTTVRSAVLKMTDLVATKSRHAAAAEYITNQVKEKTAQLAEMAQCNSTQTAA